MGTWGHDEQTTDGMLVCRARSGDRSAFRMLHRRHAGLVAGVVASCARRSDVDDLCQETFTKAWTELPRLRDPDLFRPWLLRIARNVVTDQQRHAARRPSPGSHLVDEAEPTDELRWVPHMAAEAHELADQVRIGLASLSARDHRVVTLAADDGASNDEIARELGITAGNARVILHRARRRLRTRLVPVLAS